MHGRTIGGSVINVGYLIKYWSAYLTKGDNLMEGSEVVSEFNASNIDEVANAPGLYAWYQQLYLTDADYSALGAVNNGDIAIPSSNILDRQTRIFSHLSLELSGKGAFGINWKAFLTEETQLDKYSVDGEKSLYKSIGDEQNEGLGSAGSDNYEEQQFFRCLTNAVQTIGPPIYIGKAISLNERIARHIYDLRRVKRGIKEDPEFKKALHTKLKEKSLSFGYRAAAAGLKEDELIVKTVNFKEIFPNESDKKLVQIAEKIEYLLNRWYRPHLGRM
jgi:hypothetical protein